MIRDPLAPLNQDNRRRRRSRLAAGGLLLGGAALSGALAFVLVSSVGGIAPQLSGSRHDGPSDAAMIKPIAKVAAFSGSGASATGVVIRPLAPSAKQVSAPQRTVLTASVLIRPIVASPMLDRTTTVEQSTLPVASTAQFASGVTLARTDPSGLAPLAGSMVMDALRATNAVTESTQTTVAAIAEGRATDLAVLARAQTSSSAASSSPAVARVAPAARAAAPAAVAPSHVASASAARVAPAPIAAASRSGGPSYAGAGASSATEILQPTSNLDTGNERSTSVSGPRGANRIGLPTTPVAGASSGSGPNRIGIPATPPSR